MSTEKEYLAPSSSIRQESLSSIKEEIKETEEPSDIETFEILPYLLESKYGQIIELIIDNKGCIFGGFLRDIVAKNPPNDIDIVILKKNFENFQKAFGKVGYKFEGRKQDNSTLIYSKKDNIKIEVLVEDDELEGYRLGPSAAPDYDVNLLALDKDGIFEWTGDADVDKIMNNIKNKRAVPIEPDYKRQEKIIKKGYLIVKE